MDLRELLAALRANWWAPVAGLTIGAIAAVAVSFAQTPLYTSRTELFVNITDSTSTSEAVEGNQFSRQRVASYARLITSDVFVDRVIDRLDLDLGAQAVTSRVTATAVPDTVVLQVAVVDPSAERAQEIARAIGAEFPDLVTELEATAAGGGPAVKVTVTDRPEVASAASSPRVNRNVALGALGGLLLGIGVALLRSRLDRSVKDPEEAAALAGAPVIATILRDPEVDRLHLVVRENASRAAEDYRQLRTSLQFLNVDEPPRVIMMSSALPSEGKTTVVINLAMALAKAGQKVAVIDADLRRPKVTRYLGMVGGVGLTNVLAGTARLDEVAQSYGVDALPPDGELTVVAAGPVPPNPSELLASSTMLALLEKLRIDNDFVLVDAPPLLPVADSTGLAVMVDGVLLAVRYGGTTKEQLRQAATLVDRVGGKMLGIVLNIVPPRADVAAAQGYGYAYGYRPDPADERS